MTVNALSNVVPATTLQDVQWPHPKDPDWRYAPFKRQDFAEAHGSQPSPKPNLPPYEAKLSVATPYTFVFYNGHCIQQPKVGLPFSFQCIDPATATEQPAVARLPKAASHSFTAWSEANCEAILLVSLPDETILEHPVLICHICDSPQQSTLVHTRLHCELGSKSCMQLIEQTLGEGSNATFCNMHTSIELAAQASLKHAVLESGNAHTHALAQRQVSLHENSHYVGTLFCQQLNKSRQQLQIDCKAPYAVAEVQALQHARLQQQHDLHICVHHLAPHCRSHTTVRGSMGGRSRGALTGRLQIAPKAHHSEAHLQHKSLLLSPHAEADSQPQLVIDNDDVKASHGATVGQLDAAALFYLQQRGLARAEAVRLLVKSFIDVVVAAIPMQDVQAFIEQQLSETLDAI